MWSSPSQAQIGPGDESVLIGDKSCIAPLLVFGWSQEAYNRGMTCGGASALPICLSPTTTSPTHRSPATSSCSRTSARPVCRRSASSCRSMSRRCAFSARRRMDRKLRSVTGQAICVPRKMVRSLYLVRSNQPDGYWFRLRGLGKVNVEKELMATTSNILKLFSATVLMA